MDTAPPRDSPSSDDAPAVEPDDILAIRLGPGANCSSIGSALDLLFLSAVAGVGCWYRGHLAGVLPSAALPSTTAPAIGAYTS